MTEAQIRYLQMKEAGRHNLAQEHMWAEQLTETKRSNLAKEGLTAYQIDTQAATSRYATDVQAETSRANAQLSAETQRYVTDQNVAASRYATETSAETATYRADLEHEDREARLEFDRETQAFKNKCEDLRLELDEIATWSSVAKQQQEVKKIKQDAQHDIIRLQNECDRLGLDKEKAWYDNLLKACQSIETTTRSAKNVIETIVSLRRFLQLVGH